MTLLANPINEEAVLLYNSTASGLVKIRVADTLGRSLIQCITAVAKGTNQLKLRTSHLPKGAYCLELVHGEDQDSLELVKE